MDDRNQSAIVVKRGNPNEPIDTSEIVSLVESAGYSVSGVVTQQREEDSEYNIGSGKMAEVSYLVNSKNADVLVFDNELDPYQKYNLGVYFPEEITVLDRYSLILKIFENRATTRHGQLQVELAKLRYELPRVESKVRLSQKEEKPGFMGLGEYDQNQAEDIKRQISNIQEELEAMEQDKKKRRKDRRERGFDLVALTGYTNAGKSTLLRRLAQDHSVDENESLHPDLDPTAKSEDRLFTTLETTTRRMDFDNRDILVTDTVGLISDLPQWLLDSFKSTFDSVYNADLVLLVVDMSEPIEQIREKIISCQDMMKHRTDSRIITVFNKIDQLDDSEVEQKMSILDAITTNSISVSASTGDNISQLKQQIHKTLPPLERKRLYIPMVEDTMSFISWIHDNAYVIEKDYDEEGVVVDFEAHPDVINKAINRLPAMKNEQ